MRNQFLDSILDCDLNHRLRYDLDPYLQHNRGHVILDNNLDHVSDFQPNETFGMFSDGVKD